MDTAPVVHRLDIVIDLILRGRDIGVLVVFSILITISSLTRTRVGTIASVVIANHIHLKGPSEEDVMIKHSSTICSIAMTEDDGELSPREGEVE